MAPWFKEPCKWYFDDRKGSCVCHLHKTEAKYMELNRGRTFSSEQNNATNVLACYFLKVQGLEVKINIVYQKNQSALRLEKNGKGSSNKRARYISIYLFIVTDHMTAVELNVNYCPTELMVVDFYTKPLQGCTLVELEK